MDELTIITGCARSGTSLTAGIIELCGAFGGVTCGPTAANKKGQFENTSIRNELTKPFLKKHGYDPMGQHPLPDIEYVKSVADSVADVWRERVLSIFKAQGYKGGPFYIKEAKSCLIWPVWKAAFPEAKWVIVRRSDEDIINSCLRTGFMRAYKGREGWQKWVDHHKDRFAEIDGLETWPEETIAGNLEPIKGVVEKLGLAWDEEAVREFIEPKLWKREK